MLKKIINWIVWSSEDPESVALTVKGLFTYASAYIIWFAAVSPLHLVILNSDVSVFAIQASAVVGAILTIVGALRKIFYLVADILSQRQAQAAAQPAQPVPAPAPQDAQPAQG